jgi:hypothetical protein
VSIVFPPVSDPELQLVLDILSVALTDMRGLWFVGDGDPNTVVTASPPAIYLNRAAGAATTLYVKESGVATDTGWVGK